MACVQSDLLRGLVRWFTWHGGQPPARQGGRDRGGQRGGNDDSWSATSNWSRGAADPNDSLPPARLVGPPPMRPPSRKALLLIGLATLLVGVLIGTAYVLNATASPSMAQAYPTATVPPLTKPTALSQGATMTPVPTAVPPPGWVSAGPSFAQMITFDPGDPNTAYICGIRQGAGNSAASSLSARHAPLPLSSLDVQEFTVGVSHDGGATWTLDQPSVQGSSCSVAINPTNPQSAVLIVDGCTNCPNVSLNRTDDGGRTWVALATPQMSGRDPSQFLAAVWVGGTLFATPFSDPTSNTPQHYLAVSVNSGPFTWADTTDLFTSATQQKAPQLIGEGSTVYAVLPGKPCSVCSVLAVSTNNGVSWNHLFPKDQGASLSVMGGSSINGTLYATTNVDATYTPLERSTDGGVTWHPMPNPPSIIVSNNYGDAPDGTLYAPFSEGVVGFVPGIYRFDPLTGKWHLAADFPTGTGIAAVQVDAKGHPRAIWGQADINTFTQLRNPGLQRHLP